METAFHYDVYKNIILALLERNNVCYLVINDLMEESFLNDMTTYIKTLPQHKNLGLLRISKMHKEGLAVTCMVSPYYSPILHGRAQFHVRAMYGLAKDVWGHAWWNTFYDSISYYTTYQVLGKWESNIPPGFISLALYNGGILTLLIQSIGVGGILRKLDSLFLNSRLRSNPLIMCAYLVLFDLAWFALQNGDPALIIQTSIPFLVLVIYLFTFGKARISDQRVLHQSYFK